MIDFEKEIFQLNNSIDNLLVEKKFFSERLNFLSESVAQAKSREKLQPEINEFLCKFQDIMHNKSIGIYEKLLTAFVNEVLPGNRQIKFNLKIKNDLPALDIDIVKGGKKESILDGAGGAVTNLISVGLKLIALSRSANFPFLVLDEADCWIKPSRLPKFAEILGKIANEIGIQILIISHHDSGYFKNFSRIIKLNKTPLAITTEIMHDSGCLNEDKNQQKTIREIRLVNYMAHTDTLLQLANGITCLTGENDIGKSSIVSALRSVFYGESRDIFIQHDKKQASVEILFSNGYKILFEHFLNKSPKRRWRLYAPDITEPLFDESPKNDPPKWLTDFCSIKKEDGLDVQLGNQKEPIFLLTESPSTRASILAIGKEINYLQQMTAINKKKS